MTDEEAKKTKTCCIVGHGTSLNTNNLGYIIDSHDYVMRIKNGIALTLNNPHAFGSKTTHVVIPDTTLSGPVDIKEQASLYSESVVKYLYALKPQQFPEQFIIRYDKLAYWLARYRVLHSGRVPYFSTGTSAVLYACAELDINTLALFGFDAYRHPGNIYSNSFGKKILEGHEWALERLIVEEIANAENVVLVFVE